MRPKALDLYCGAGGASMGLHRAGFEVFGVDIRPQPRYPFWFRLADALDVDLDGYDLIWASPPCQRFAACTPGRRRDRYPDLIAATRERLAATSARTVIENVPRAPVRPDVILEGSMFGLGVIRRRHFETNFFALTVGNPSSGRGRVRDGLAVTVAGGGRGPDVIARWSVAMGIDWMTRRELAQAVPPAYAEFLGRWAKKATAVKAAA